MIPLPRASVLLALALVVPACGGAAKALPDLPPPEYEPARQFDLNAPKPAAPATASPAAPSAAPAAPPPSAAPAPPAAAPKG